MVSISGYKQIRICEDFSCNNYTGSSTTPLYTSNFYEEYSNSNYWGILPPPSAYNIGSGAARFKCRSAPGGIQQSLISYQFPNAPSNTYLTFDVAYQPRSGGNVDSLIIETSNNFGASYTIRQKLWEVLDRSRSFKYCIYRWRDLHLQESNGHRGYIQFLQVQIRSRSEAEADPNNIWVDNLCVQTLTTPVANTIGLINQAMFVPEDPIGDMRILLKFILQELISRM
ncbi:MAG: hypothetical protein R3A12_01830 [Ignavibacteria bacterium]